MAVAGQFQSLQQPLQPAAWACGGPISSSTACACRYRVARPASASAATIVSTSSMAHPRPVFPFPDQRPARPQVRRDGRYLRAAAILRS